MTKGSHALAGLVTGAVLAGVASLALPAGGAQDPAKLAPEMYKVVLENDHVRVIDYHLKPGEREPMHSHPKGIVVYYFTDAKMRQTLPDGTSTEASNKAGDVLWRDPVTHRAENVGGAEIHALLVEPKDAWGK